MPKKPLPDFVAPMIGKPELALLLAKEALNNTTEVLSPTTVAEVLGISRNGATNKIENCAISERTTGVGRLSVTRFTCGAEASHK